jgi:hypothetical protein
MPARLSPPAAHPSSASTARSDPGTRAHALPEPTREQLELIDRVALAAGRVRVESLAGCNVRLTIIVDPDGNAVD